MNFLKQMHEIGLTRQMPLSGPVVNDSDLWAAGPEAAFGVFPKLWNYTGAHNTPGGLKFAQDYRTKYGAPPEVQGWQDWFGTTAILTAIKETGSTDSTKLVAFLEEHKFEGYKDTPIWFRNFDHQLIQPVLVASAWTRDTMPSPAVVRGVAPRSTPSRSRNVRTDALPASGSSPIR